MDDNIAAKRNAPHISKVTDFSKQIEAIGLMVDKTTTTEWEKVIFATGQVLADIRASFSNREISIVMTKLEEANQWAGVKHPTYTRMKLYEARFWCTSYINVLKND